MMRQLLGSFTSAAGTYLAQSGLRGSCMGREGTRMGVKLGIQCVPPLRLVTLRLLVLAAAGVVSLGHSGATQVNAAAEQPQALPPWKLDSAVSGGGAGIMEHLSLQSHGQMMVTAGRRSPATMEQAPPELVSQVTAFLQGRDFTRPPRALPKRDGVCADDLYHSATVSWGGREYPLFVVSGCTTTLSDLVSTK